MENPTKKSAAKRPIWLYAIGGAAILIATVLWWRMGKTDNLSAEQLTDSYLTERFNNLSTQPSKSDENALWVAAKQAYTKDDFVAAAKNIEGIQDPNDEQIFYKALSWMYQTPPNYDKASAGFIELMRRNVIFVNESQWFYLLISLKKGEKEACISMLENVIGKHNAYSEKAAALLKKLK
jgi:hypothetical protein